MARAIGRFIFFWSVRLQVIQAERPEEYSGPYLLALTHLSHLDPFLCCVVVRRKIDFIASVGFYRYRLAAWLMGTMQTIAIKREGVPISAVRKAVAHLKAGRVVGICPEGGVAQGGNSAMRGAKIKRGVCLLAQRAQVPVLPAIMLGTDKLNCVPPWIPYKRARLWVAFGQYIEPPAAEVDRRVARRILADKIETAYGELYRELKERYGLEDSVMP